MYYEKIPGWFDFQSIYKRIVGSYPEGKFVEIGSWLGRSTCFMGETLKANKSRAKFYAVDTFLGERNATDQQEIVTAEGGSIYKRFLLNMKAGGVLDYVTPLQMKSQDAAELFDDESLDFVFIDAEHVYEDVKNDILTWEPKIKQGGLLAGHDFYGSGVRKAVEELLPGIAVDFNSWIFPII